MVTRKGQGKVAAVIWAAFLGVSLYDWGMRGMARWRGLGGIPRAGALILLMTTASATTPSTSPPPTLANVAYGSDPRQVLDFWKAPSDKPTPLVFYIHGGGWVGGTKEGLDLTYDVSRYQAAGISVVSIEYRYLKQTILKDKSVPLPVITAEKVASEDPPVVVPLRDAMRALQFVRSKAAEWNIDKSRIALSGGSAGGCTSLWLAFHQDMADPASTDPIARESTRAFCVALGAPQTTLDPHQMKEWTPNSQYGGHAFGFAWDPNDHLSEFNHFLAQREVVLPWIKLYSPYGLMTADAPPLYLYYGRDGVPAKGKEQKDPTHTANFGAILAERAKELGVPCEFVYEGESGVAHPTIGDYLLDKLKVAGKE
jgi:acetyl esterase/lipase